MVAMPADWQWRLSRLRNAGDGYQPGMDVEVLLELERAGWDALCEATGSAFYGEIMTDDALMILANGQVMSRDDVVAALREAPTWSAYAIDVPRLVEIGSDTAALVYEATGWRDEQPDPFVGAMASVYVRSDAGWKLALYQQTEIARG